MFRPYTYYEEKFYAIKVIDFLKIIKTFRNKFNEERKKNRDQCFCVSYLSYFLGYPQSKNEKEFEKFLTRMSLDANFVVNFDSFSVSTQRISELSETKWGHYQTHIPYRNFMSLKGIDDRCEIGIADNEYDFLVRIGKECGINITQKID